MTYSVAAVDRDEGVMGVAVQSHWLAVGGIVPWAAAGTGVLATQANSDLAAGRRGLELLAFSRSAEATLAGLLRDDPRAAVSQIAVLDAAGQVAVHTGDRCVAEAGHRAGRGWSVQANMMLRPTVPDAMAAAWAESRAASSVLILPARFEKSLAAWSSTLFCSRFCAFSLA